ncbi:hypothetical protein GCM10010344_63730 [Streptomyces bluensis]|nr:hypothetical protein GCM10010344_63730 [Streptomyces bluensis]
MRIRHALATATLSTTLTLGAAFLLPASAQAATTAPSTASGWVTHSGPYPSQSQCETMAEYWYGFTPDEYYCNQLGVVGRWYIIHWE